MMKRWLSVFIIFALCRFFASCYIFIYMFLCQKMYEIGVQKARSDRVEG